MLAELFAIRARAVVVGLLIELPCRLVAAQAMHEDHYTRLRGGESCSECRTRDAEPHTVAIEAELRRDRVAATDQMISEQTAERAEREVGTRMCGRSRLRRLRTEERSVGEGVVSKFRSRGEPET